MYTEKDMQAVIKDLNRYIKERDNFADKFYALEAKLETIGDISTIEELAERIETLEDDLSTAEEDIRELKNELEERKLPKHLDYIETDYLSCMQDKHFQDELEALIRKYKGF